MSRSEFDKAMISGGEGAVPIWAWFLLLCGALFLFELARRCSCHCNRRHHDGCQLGFEFSPPKGKWRAEELLERVVTEKPQPEDKALQGCALGGRGEGGFHSDRRGLVPTQTQGGGGQRLRPKGNRNAFFCRVLYYFFVGS